MCQKSYEMKSRLDKHKKFHKDEEKISNSSVSVAQGKKKALLIKSVKKVFNDRQWQDRKFLNVTQNS